MTTEGQRVVASQVQAGWLLRDLSDDATHVDWLEIHMVLHTVRGGGLPKRVWIYLKDRAKPVLLEWDDVVHVRKV